jgi:hypothetical protein
MDHHAGRTIAILAWYSTLRYGRIWQGSVPHAFNKDNSKEQGNPMTMRTGGNRSSTIVRSVRPSGSLFLPPPLFSRFFDRRHVRKRLGRSGSVGFGRSRIRHEAARGGFR